MNHDPIGTITQAVVAAASPAGLACPSCSATFGRQEHLQRHITSTHTVDRPFPCTFCTQAFARRDVLVRHLKSCKAKTGNSVSNPSVPPRRRGRKRKSCDACARLKRACSGTHPCLSCVHRKQSCSFPGTTISVQVAEQPYEKWALDGDESSSEEDWETHVLAPLTNGSARERDVYTIEQSTISQPVPQIVQPFAPSTAVPFDPGNPPGLEPISGAQGLSTFSLEFLANFTNTKGMASSFDCGAVEQRAFIMENILSSPRFASQQAIYNSDTEAANKTQHIVSAIKEAVESRWRCRGVGMSWSHDLELSCFQFFALHNLHRLIELYWAFWHPNCAIIHQPTFSIANSSASLVATMALIGAVLSPEDSDRQHALGWLDFVEEWVFSSASFSDDPLPYDPQDITNPGLRHRLDALRAAYCAILLQTWEGTEEAKRRNRRSRYTDIIGAFRSVCFRTVTHENLQSYLCGPSLDVGWKQFAMKEELIRTLTYIVLLDNAYVIFNNTPSRMALQECRIALACPDACFQAEDPHAWQDALRMWDACDLGLQRFTITQVVCLIWNQRTLISQRDWAMLRQMSSLHMFTIVHPLHSQLFHIRGHPMPGNQTSLLRQALDNWKDIHAERTGILELPEIIPTDAQGWWKRVGFPRYAYEYWCLADFILTSYETVTAATSDLTRNVNESLISQLLNRYDESDMSQVHGLVTLFSTMNLF